MKTKLIYLVGGFVLALLLGAALRDETVERSMKDQNESLRRIATSLEIIAGQRQGWKLPK